MTRKNLKISEEWYNRHEPRKDYYGLSWEKYFDAGCPDIPADDGRNSETEK